jgi:hypothetical protein
MKKKEIQMKKKRFFKLAVKDAMKRCLMCLATVLCVLGMVELTNAGADKNAHTHSLKISDMKLVPISSSGCKVEISLSVFDETGNFGPRARINWAIELADGRYSAGETTFPEKSDEIHSKDANHSTLKTILSLGSPLSTCKGKSVLYISVADNSGNESNTLHGAVEFK